MNNARETACWGALPRRQRRLQRSNYSTPGVAVVILPALTGVAAVVAYLSLAPFS